jgi:hypothetical protein
MGTADAVPFLMMQNKRSLFRMSGHPLNRNALLPAYE